MKRSKLLSLCLFLLPILLFPLSGEPVSLDLQTCLSLALENNPGLKISGLDLAVSRRESSHTWNAFLPGISAGAGYSESSPLTSGPYDPSRTLSGSVNLNLSLNAGLAANARGIKLSLENEEISYGEAEKSLLSAVEKEFYYLITSASNLEIVKADLDLSWKNYDQVENNYRHGMASELTLLQAMVSASNQEPVYKQAVATHEARMNEFLLTIGLEPETQVTLEGSLDREIWEGDAKELAERYLPARSDIQRLIRSREILENRKKQTALQNRTPTLRLSGGWSTSKRDEGEWTDGISMGVNVNIPLDTFIYGSSTSLSLKELDDQISRNAISLESALNEGRTEIINLVNQLNVAADNTRLSSLNIELAEESFRQTEESFSRGLSQHLEVEKAQQELFSARQQYLSNQYNYLTNLINLRDALGLASLDDLK